MTVQPTPSLNGRRAARALRAMGLAMLGAAGLAAASVAEVSVLGERGAVHALVNVTLGSVDATAPADRAGNPVLALETRIGGSVKRILVPTTEDGNRESFENLVFERTSASLFAVWQGFVAIHPVVYLAEFRGGSWSTPLMVTRDAFSNKFAPQLVVTRDSSGTGATRLERTILHVLYVQEPIEGEYEALYAPVVLHNGQYAGQHPIYRLNDLALDGMQAPTYPISRSLLRRPTLQRGLDDRTLVASFADANSGRLLSIELGPLPLQISRVATEARAQIIITGVRSMGRRGSVERQAFANAAHADVVARAVSGGFTPSAAAAFADAVRQVALAEEGDDEPALQRIAGEARAQIIITGARGRRHGIESASLASAIVSWTPGDDSGEEDMQFELLADRIIPRSGAEVENRVYSSADGRRALVGWTDGVRYMRYRESETDETWSEVRELNLSAELSLQMAREILDAKVD